MDLYNDLIEDDSNQLNSAFRFGKEQPNKVDKGAQQNSGAERRAFLRYGTGIVNYFVLQEHLIKLFFILSLIAVP